MKKAPVKQNTPEWLEFRKDKIGSSDAPIIMGSSPWATPYQLWEYKVGLRGETEKNEAMKRGNALEPQARAEFIKQSGIYVEPEARINLDRHWQIASLDGYNEERSIAVEIKVPGQKDHEEALSGKIPEKYIPQLQHIMAVCSLNFVFYFSYNETSSKIITLERDEAFIQKLIKAEEEFYQCMVHFEPPCMDERDYVLREDAEWNTKAKQWMALNSRLKEIELAEDSIRKELIQLASSRNTQGAGIRVKKSIRKGRVDYNQIPELKDVDLNIYRKGKIECWTIEKK